MKPPCGTPVKSCASSQLDLAQTLVAGLPVCKKTSNYTSGDKSEKPRPPATPFFNRTAEVCLSFNYLKNPRHPVATLLPFGTSCLLEKGEKWDSMSERKQYYRANYLPFQVPARWSPGCTSTFRRLQDDDRPKEKTKQHESTNPGNFVRNRSCAIRNRCGRKE